MTAIAIDSLLDSISTEAPCGDNLEYDPQFVQMEAAAQGKPELQYGATLIPAEEPNWQDVQNKALELLTRTKDLRVAVYLIQALLNTQGLSGFSDGLVLLRGLLERYWEDLHPQLEPNDDYDPTLRVNTLASLCRPETVLRSLRETPLVSSPALGEFTLRDIEVALGKLAPLTKDASTPELSVIDGALMNCPLETLQTLAQAARQAAEQTTQIEALLTERVGVRQAADLSALTSLLQELQHFLNERLARRGVMITATALDAQAASPETGAGATAPAAVAPQAISGEITSREDIVRLLDKMCDYLNRHEPSSPVPLLLNRAKRLMTMGFLDILRDLAPAGVAQAEVIRGADSDRSTS